MKRAAQAYLRPSQISKKPFCENSEFVKKICKKDLHSKSIDWFLYESNTDI